MSPLQGSPSLRAALAEYYSVPPDCVLCCVPQEGIYLTMRCLAHMLGADGEPLHAIYTWPAYQSLSEVLTISGAEMTPWPIEATGSGWSFSLEKLEGLVRPSTKILVVNFPHNPSSWRPSPQQWDSLLNFCAERNIFLFSDEIYRFLSIADSGSEHAKPLRCAVNALPGNAALMSGFSKCFGMPGIRLGWIVTRNAALMQLLKQYKDYLTICSPAPCEVLGRIAFRHRDNLFARLRHIIQGNLSLMDKLSARFPEAFHWYSPLHGTVALVRLGPALLRHYHDTR